MHTFEAKFKLGDRVKLKKSPIGRIATIVGIHFEYSDNNNKEQGTNYEISIKNYEDNYIMKENELVLFPFTNVILI